jgi:hypothetical protein
MCFSAEASFTGAAFLGLIGCINVKLIKEKRQILLAIIPFFFAIQQLVEGFLWLTMENSPNFSSVQFYRYAPIEQTIFLTIAIFVWPILIPLSLLIVEYYPWRRKILSILLGIGIFYVLVSLMGFIEIKDAHGISVRIVGHTIQYVIPIQHGMIYSILYCLPTLASPFFSSLNRMWIFAFGNLIGFFVSQYLFYETSISVWCFFCAWVSLGLSYVLYSNKRTLISND